MSKLHTNGRALQFSAIVPNKKVVANHLLQVN
jgi:hypothetical protein